MSTSQHSFHFSFVLHGIDQNLDEFEDALGASGCNDALVHQSSNAIFIDFEREALSLEEAVISAIKDISECSVNVKVASIFPDLFDSVSDIEKNMRYA